VSKLPKSTQARSDNNNVRDVIIVHVISVDAQINIYYNYTNRHGKCKAISGPAGCAQSAWPAGKKDRDKTVQYTTPPTCLLWKQIFWRTGLILNCFMLSSVPCIPTFCCSAMYPYTFKCFFTLYTLDYFTLFLTIYNIDKAGKLNIAHFIYIIKAVWLHVWQVLFHVLQPWVMS